MCEWTGCIIGDGEEIKRGKNGGPPTFLPTASQQGGREEVNNLAGGAWRGLEECWDFGGIFLVFVSVLHFSQVL